MVSEYQKYMRFVWLILSVLTLFIGTLIPLAIAAPVDFTKNPLFTSLLVLCILGGISSIIVGSRFYKFKLSLPKAEGGRRYWIDGKAVPKAEAFSVPSVNLDMNSHARFINNFKEFEKKKTNNIGKITDNIGKITDNITNAQEKTLLIKFKKILKHSSRISQKDVALMLEINESLFKKLLFKWMDTLPFLIDGDDIVVNNMDEFLNAIDKEFAEWEENEEKNKGKSKNKS